MTEFWGVLGVAGSGYKLASSGRSSVSSGNSRNGIRRKKMPPYELTLGCTLNGGWPIWQVWDAEGRLVFVTELKSAAEAWLDQQEDKCATPSNT